MDRDAPGFTLINKPRGNLPGLIQRALGRTRGRAGPCPPAPHSRGAMHLKLRSAATADRDTTALDLHATAPDLVVVAASPRLDLAPGTIMGPLPLGMATGALTARTICLQAQTCRRRRRPACCRTLASPGTRSPCTVTFCGHAKPRTQRLPFSPPSPRAPSPPPSPSPGIVHRLPRRGTPQACDRVDTAHDSAYAIGGVSSALRV